MCCLASDGRVCLQVFHQGFHDRGFRPLQIRNWTDKEGNKRRSAEVVADNVYFGESKRGSEGASSYNSSYGNSNGGYNSSPAPAPSYGGGYSAPAAAPASDFAMLEDDDAQLPF